MAIFGAEGIRDAIRKSYEKHYELAQQGKLPTSADDPHYAGLFGALGSRYRLQGKYSEQMVFLEVIPFWRLDHSTGKEAIAEYVVYMESPRDARRDWLSSQIKEGLRKLASEKGDTSDGILMVAQVAGVKWLELV